MAALPWPVALHHRQWRFFGTAHTGFAADAHVCFGKAAPRRGDSQWTSVQGRPCPWGFP